MPREADSRTLAEHLCRYFEAFIPEICFIENVEEFMSWGPLDNNGKPLSRQKGRDYIRWTNNVQKLGYNFDWKILNAADYGAYTSRKRYFAQFAKPEIEIVWPEATHAKRIIDTPLFQTKKKKWKAVKHVLDLDKHGNTIFGRKKNLSDNTYKRIYYGLIKFIAGGKDKFLLKYNSMSKNGTYTPPSIDDPSPTVSTQGRIGIVNTHFISKYFSGNPYDKNHSINDPAGVVTTNDHHSFITTYHGNGANIHSMDNPAPTVPTKDSQALISSQFISRDFKSPTHSSIEEPSGTITTVPKSNLVTTDYYLMNPQFKSKGSSIENPCFTLIARMDKTPPYLIEVSPGSFAIKIEENDTEHMILIKEFMAMYGIIDIKMRMLNIKELLRIQGFPDDYHLIGTQAEQKKYIGNAVEVNQAKVILETSSLANTKHLNQKAI